MALAKLPRHFLDLLRFKGNQKILSILVPSTNFAEEPRKKGRISLLREGKMVIWRAKSAVISPGNDDGWMRW
jgi:hypothetical protein